MPGLLPRLMIRLSGGCVIGQGEMTETCVMAAGSEAEGEVRVQNADGSVEVQPEEELWDATSSSDVSPIADATHDVLHDKDWYFLVPVFAAPGAAWALSCVVASAKDILGA